MSEESQLSRQPYRFSWKDAAIAVDIVIAIVLNRYSAVLPFAVILGLVIFAVLLVGIWAWSAIAHDSFGKHLRNFPLSCFLLFVVFVVLVIQSVVSLESKLHVSASSSHALKQGDVAATGASGSVGTTSTATPTNSVTAKPQPPVKTIKAPLTSAQSVVPVVTAPKNQTATYQQQCTGCAQAQGPGAHATYVQNGAPKLVITDEQIAAVSKAMKPFAGMNIAVMLDEPQTEDSHDFGEKLAQALRTAGINCGEPSSASVAGGVVPSGVVINAGVDNSDAAKALQNALNNPKHGGSKAKINDNVGTKDWFVVGVTPYR